MKRLILSLSFLIGIYACNGQPGPPSIETGAVQFSRYLPLLKGKRVGMVVNQTSTVKSTHLVDTLISLGVDIRKVFAPEHGFRGEAEAGESVTDGVDNKTQLPIVSLYGRNKKPTPEQVADLDVLVFDIQDVGTRFYTYISTMHYIMEAAAENAKSVIVLDRPNPNGMYVDGPIREEGFKSFVGLHPIPILHGLTVGELALMINGEGWLETSATCQLTVIPCIGYTHNTHYPLPVKPSPNLPNDLSVQLYPSLCLFEGTVISVGRGTPKPFQQIGHPLFKGMHDQFTPRSIEGMARHPKHENEICYGISFTEPSAVRGLSLRYLIDFYQIYNGREPYFTDYFGKLAGTATLQQQIENGMTEAEIRQSWEPGLQAYKEMRLRYLLYP